MLITTQELEKDVFDYINNLIKNNTNNSNVYIERKTYSELKELKDNKKLLEGQKYLLTDYKTKYEQPDTKIIKECDIEELLLTASSNNTFESIVYSIKYPKDIIYYDFDNNKCEDKKTPRNGFITHRHDTINNNKCPYDFRTMLWARWCPDEKQYYKDDKLVDYEVWTSGETKLDVIYKADDKLLIAKKVATPKDKTDINVFNIIYNDITIGCLRNDKTQIPNKTKIELKKGKLHERLTFGDTCHNNSFGNGCQNNVLGDSCNKNTFGNNCDNNVFSNTCDNNTFGNSCDSNTFGSGCDNNSFGNNCDNNSFGNCCDCNKFGNNCDSNIFCSNCNNNSLNNHCYSNNFGNSCYNNSFGNSCDNNSFGENCSSNSFGNSCIGSTFGNRCMYLVIKNLYNKDLTNLDIYNKLYTINIEENSSDKYIYWFLDENNKPIYKQIP